MLTNILCIASLRMLVTKRTVVDLAEGRQRGIRIELALLRAGRHARLHLQFHAPRS